MNPLARPEGVLRNTRLVRLLQMRQNGETAIASIGASVVGYPPLPSKSRTLMERWRRAFAENDKNFKELFGVKKEIFLRIHDILTAAALERRKKEGRRPALSPGDQLLLTLQYWREYRTMKHIAFDFAKSTVSDNTTAQRIGNDIEKSTLFLPYFSEQNNLSSPEMFLNNNLITSFFREE